MAEVLDLVDQVCDRFYDPEFTTACRRFLAFAARAAPRYFSRIRRAEPTAAAICWIVEIDNHDAWRSSRPPMQKDILRHLDMYGTTPSQRAWELLRALDYGYMEAGAFDLQDERWRIARR